MTSIVSLEESRHNPPLDEQVALADVTRQRLVQFRQRRVRLLRCRTAGLITTIFVGTLFAAILMDAMFFHLAARWLGSLFVYGTLLGSGLVFWLRNDTQKFDLTEEARRVEQLAPRFREQVLPAVEMSDTKMRTLGSVAFQQQLQTQLAEQMEWLDVETLLPWRLAKNRVRLAGAQTMFVILLCLIPGLHLPQRMARILLPIADVGRVGRIAISIERPLPNSRLVPTGDIIAITALAVGPRPDSLSLESRTANTLASSIVMNRSDGNRGRHTGGQSRKSRFEATLVAEGGWIEYRVTGQGAQTPWYRLTTKPRPSVASFEKRLTLPAYAGSQTVTLVEPDGNLKVIAGSQVQLRLSINQPVARAVLRWEKEDVLDGHAPPAIALEHQALSDQLVAAFTADQSRTYKIELQSSETSFTNPFSPTYRLHVLPDAPPHIAWQQPTTSSIIATTDQVLSITAEVEDELPVEQVRLLSRNNTDPWQDSLNIAEIQLQAESHNLAYHAFYHWEVDLLPLRLEAGDSMELKLVAIDKAQQVSESSLLTIMLTSTATELAADQYERDRKSLADQLEQLAVDIDALSRQLRQSLQTLQPNLSDANIWNTARDKTQELAKQFHRQTSQVQSAVQATLADSEHALHGYELLRLGETLATLQTGRVLSLEQLTTRQSLPAEKAKPQLEELSQTVSALAADAQQIANHFRALVTYDILLRHAGQLSQLAKAQQNLANTSWDGSSATAQLERRQNVLTQQLEAVQQSIIDSLPEVRPASVRHLQRTADQVGFQIEQARRSTTTTPVAARKLAQSLSDNLNRLRLMNQLDGSMANSLSEAYRQLQGLAGLITQPLWQVVDDFKTGVLDLPDISRAGDPLAIRRSLQRVSAYGDRLLAGDLGNAQRAIQWLAEQSTWTEQQTVTAVSEIADAIGTLQAISSVAESQNLLADLLRLERSPIDTADGLRTSPRAWLAFTTNLEQAVRALDESHIPQDLLAKLQELTAGSMARKAHQKISIRNSQTDSLPTAATELEYLEENLRELQRDLQPYAHLARQQLKQFAPQIAELARQAADETTEVEVRTRQLSEELQRDQVPNTDARLEQLNADVRQLSKPLQDLREALADHADTQDLLDRNQLQIARHADVAMDLVDHVEEQVSKSLESVQSSESSLRQSDELELAANTHATSAAALNELAEQFERNMTNGEFTEEELNERLAELHRQLLSVAESSDLANSSRANANSAKYDQAEKLADLASADPQSALEQLEQELQTNEAMQAAMSDIARQAAQQALELLEQATHDQSAVGWQLKASDPEFLSQKELFLHDLRITHAVAAEQLMSILSETRWTAGASRESQLEKTLDGLEKSLQQALQITTQDLETTQTVEELQATAKRLHERLRYMGQTLNTSSEQLQQAGHTEFHQNGADLSNRRREMRDRQQRMQQQLVRLAQALEQNELQRLRQAEADVRQSEQQLQQEMTRLEQLREAAARNPQADETTDISNEQHPLMFARIVLEARRSLKQSLTDRAMVARSSIEALNKQEPSQLASVNPTAELSSELASQAAELSLALAEKLEYWLDTKPVSARAAVQQILTAEQAEAGIRRAVENAANDLSRAARHEMRLDNQATGEQLQKLSQETKLVSEYQIELTQEALATARQDAEQNSSPAAQAGSNHTALATTAVARTEAAIRNAAAAILDLLAAGDQQPNSSSSRPQQSQPSDSPLDDRQKAQLLDELDRRMNSKTDGELQLGEKEDDSLAPPDASSPQPPPDTLVEAADKLAKSISRTRQPPPPNSANTDLGMATESQLANAEPQPAVAVRMLDGRWLDGNWGKLRKQSTEELTEARRETVAPRFRRQVEAYFRELAERGLEIIPPGR